jgi:uncharacterized linocin/CFP29 family protein
MDILKRSYAPIVSEAWEEIDQEARRVLKTRLSGRRVVDVSGPHGFELAAVNLGRLEVPKATQVDVGYGIRRVQPLIEVREAFELDRWDLDDVARGAEPDLEAVAEAAGKVADFEEQVIFRGFAPGGIRGLTQESPHNKIALGASGAEYPQKVVEAMITLRDEGVEGPYALVLGRKPFAALEVAGCGYPPIRNIQETIGGPVIYSNVVEGGVLVSVRGGDFELTLGQDLSIGYEIHDASKVRLFLTESFTFRVLDPAAAIELTA